MRSAVDSSAASVEPELPHKSTSYQQWARHLVTHAAGSAMAQELDTWLGLPWESVGRLPVDHESADNLVENADTISVSLDDTETRRLLQEVPGAYNTQINDVLLTALTRALAPWTGRPTLSNWW